MSDETPKIDPLSNLGDILNHFEAMLMSHGAVIERVCMIAKRENIDLENLDTLYEQMVLTHKSYWDFKNGLLGVKAE